MINACIYAYEFITFKYLEFLLKVFKLLKFIVRVK